MDLESAYLGLLERTGRYVLAEGPDGRRLDLRAAGSDEPLLVFRYAGPPAEMPAARQPSGEMEAPPPDGGGQGDAP